MNIVGRRVIRLANPPGATVTIGPWEWVEFQRWLAIDFQDEILTTLTRWNEFAAKIEDHPFDVDDIRDLDGAVAVEIVRAWTAAISALPPLRGPRH